MKIFDSWLVNTYIAHRGLHNSEYPENSLGSFENAIKHGFAIEIDVHIISDGTVVVFHDEHLKRMTNKDGYLSALKSEDLNTCFLANTTYTIPTLKEVLKLVDGKTPLLIEIKNTGKVGELEASVIDILKDYKGEFAIQSFNPITLNYFFQNAPQFLRGQVSGSLKDSNLSKLKKHFLKRMYFNKSLSKPHFIAYEAAALPNRSTRKYKHLPLIAWCIKSQAEYLKVVKHCDNIIFENFLPKIWLNNKAILKHAIKILKPLHVTLFAQSTITTNTANAKINLIN